VAILAALNAFLYFNQSPGLMPATHPMRMHSAHFNISMFDTISVVVKDNVRPKHFSCGVGRILFN
jgi:hypothetical protein